MASKFRSLASITVWILFLFGCLSLLGGFGRAFMASPLPLVSSYFAFGIVSLILSIVAAALRAKIE
ncbi:MAG: hypothetical protein Q7R57_09835 [Dehalococcoidales bacterium]|nr:hypothetical protein [Dehalococcoidales bacterium]